MNNIVEVEAPLDDPDTTKTKSATWLDLHKNFYSEAILLESFRLLCEEIKEPYTQDPLTSRAIHMDYRSKEDKLRFRVEVYNLKEAVRYALGKIPWDILISDS